MDYFRFVLLISLLPIAASTGRGKGSGSGSGSGSGGGGSDTTQTYWLPPAFGTPSSVPYAGGPTPGGGMPAMANIPGGNPMMPMNAPAAMGMGGAPMNAAPSMYHPMAGAFVEEGEGHRLGHRRAGKGSGSGSGSGSDAWFIPPIYPAHMVPFGGYYAGAGYPGVGYVPGMHAPFLVPVSSEAAKKAMSESMLALPAVAYPHVMAPGVVGHPFATSAYGHPGMVGGAVAYHPWMMGAAGYGAAYPHPGAYMGPAPSAYAFKRQQSYLKARAQAPPAKAE